MDEITAFLNRKTCSARIFIIVRHFCFETWALGNKRVGPRQPKDPILRRYKSFFDVLNKDPELLSGYPPEGYNRAQFAAKYLRKMLNDRGRNVTYTKGNPVYISHPTYFNEVKKRYETTEHIKSFSTFLDAFR
jgi:hypothetical protein